jgi:hypothetical protein
MYLMLEALMEEGVSNMKTVVSRVVHYPII